MDDASERTTADLRAAQLFAHLDDEQLTKLAALARPLILPTERSLFLQGDPAAALYLLAKGRVKVFKLLRDGRTATIRHVEAGNTFAEAAWPLRLRRSPPKIISSSMNTMMRPNHKLMNRTTIRSTTEPMSNLSATGS